MSSSRAGCIRLQETEDGQMMVKKCEKKKEDVVRPFEVVVLPSRN
jgi:hypothetical protein